MVIGSNVELKGGLLAVLMITCTGDRSAFLPIGALEKDKICSPKTSESMHGIWLSSIIQTGLALMMLGNTCWLALFTNNCPVEPSGKDLTPRFRVEVDAFPTMVEFETIEHVI